MPSFSYTALDARGQEVSDVVEAASEQDAIQALRQAGYYPTSVSAGGKAAKAAAKAPKAAKGSYIVSDIARGQGKITATSRTVVADNKASWAVRREAPVPAAQAIHGRSLRRFRKILKTVVRVAKVAVKVGAVVKTGGAAA